ncbi:outer membrane beta-barrel protein [Ichthyenterobacterium sp. W332]|uniref:Outer membrane beta-barrel protein n=1 Tax=Microcosmobacter mediterraneus TaxID=3075607 RepID=A0ABU2YLI7_9FLAO|nr:carboxypeptidase regulatory-like domain-containing protein [Ichthyenterobacterium sp. W332]MDT0559012.1 outer membrane beta-barrel protein [Ichthyenterobacterium sp. W332]
MKYKLLIILLLTCTYGFSQIKVQGVVKDSTGVALELANVIAINQETKVLESFGVTNDKGKYILNLSKNTKYDLKISYLGMKTIEEVLETKEDNILKDVTMVVDNALDAVELTYEMPVTIKGDTIVYNADSFKNGTERKLEDVLEKLPGVEVNDDGEIEVEGQRVGKVMVDGKDFFDGDTKTATKNIPSNAVDKVEILKNYSEVAQTRGVTNNMDNIAINIKLKEGKKNFWFGNVTAGGGASTDNELYIFQPKLFYYSPEYSINLIGDLNNIGDVVFTRQDFFRFNGGFRAPSQGSGTNLNLGNNNLGFANSNNAVDVQTKFLAGNFSYSPNKALDLSGFAIFNSTRTLLQSQSDVIYTDSNLGIPNETTTSRTRQSSDLGMLKLSATYKPNVNNQLDYDILSRMSKEYEDRNVFSTVIGNTDQFEETTPYSINQNVNYYYTLNESNIFALSAQHLLQDEDPFYNAVLDNDPTNNNDPDPSLRDTYDNTAAGLGLDQNQFAYNVNQERRVKSNQLDAKLDYWNVLNTKSNINFYFGTILSRQTFDSGLFQFLDDNSVFTPTPIDNGGIATNDTDYRFSDIYLGARYTIKTGKFTIAPAVSMHAYGNRNMQLGEEYKDNFFRVLPDLDVRLQLKKSERLVFRYNMQNQFTDVTNLARGIVLNNYNNIFVGNPELENALSQNLSLNYFSFNLFNYTNVVATVNYNSRVDQIRPLTNFESVIRSSSVFNSPFADETVTAFGRFERTFGKIRARLSANFNYSKFNQFVQNQRSVNENYTHGYRAELRTNYREAPNLRLRYNFSIADNDQGATRTKFYTSAPSIQFDAYIWKSLTFRTDYSYTSQRQEGGDTESFDFWNAFLSYRKDRDAKFEYEIRATNLLNTKSRINNGSNNFSVSSSETFIQPRYITFRLRYEI